MRKTAVVDYLTAEMLREKLTQSPGRIRTKPKNLGKISQLTDYHAPLERENRKKKRVCLTPDSTVLDVTNDSGTSKDSADASPEIATSKKRRGRKQIDPKDLKVTIQFVPTEDYEYRKEMATKIIADCIARNKERQAQEKLEAEQKVKAETKKKSKKTDATEKKDFIQETIDFWEKRTGKTFSREDARQMIENAAGYFNILNEWDQREKTKEKERKKEKNEPT